MSKRRNHTKHHGYTYDEEHKYGFVKINARQYVKCTDPCCKSGGPAFPNVREGE